MVSTLVVNPPVEDDFGKVCTGDYVILLTGRGGVSDGQLCRVFDRGQPDLVCVYGPDDEVPLLCWTGVLAWTVVSNLVKVSGDRTRLELLFSGDLDRTDTIEIPF